jgi:hypothetical protein
MPQKPKPSAKPDDPAEYKRFLETAKEVEAETDSEAFDKAFKKVVPKPKESRSRHNAKRASS